MVQVKMLRHLKAYRNRMANVCIGEQSKGLSNVLTVELEVSEIPFNHLGS